MAKTITIIHSCCFCDTPCNFATKQKYLEHLQRHNLKLPARSIIHRRRNNDKYIYVKSKSSFIEAHFGCPLRIQHFEDQMELKLHLSNSHQETSPTEWKDNDSTLSTAPNQKQQQQGEKAPEPASSTTSLRPGKQQQRREDERTKLASESPQRPSSPSPEQLVGTLLKKKMKQTVDGGGTLQVITAGLSPAYFGR